METINAQQKFWNDWNARAREPGIPEVSRRQAEFVRQWLFQQGRRDLNILEVGCGAGWLSPILMPFGTVIATDLSDEVLDRARARWPEVAFVAGDFATLPFDPQSFDVVVSLEVLSHVEDQPAFVGRLAALLADQGILILATQNRPVLQDRCNIAPPEPGQLRRWVDRAELIQLVTPHFKVETLITATPVAHRGWRRALTSARIHNLLRPFIGEKLRDLLEKRQWGWTLMLKARKF
jgi:SAM-dependent methyltransferase